MSKQIEERERIERHDYSIVFLENLIREQIEYRGQIDKHVLTLSALAVGLLVSAFDRPVTDLEFKIWIFAGAFFVTSILLIFIVFFVQVIRLETELEHLKILIDHERDEKVETVFEFLSHGVTILSIIAFCCFFVGVSLTFGLAYIQIIKSLSQGFSS